MRTIHSYDKVASAIARREIFQTRERPLMDGGYGRHLFSAQYHGTYAVYSFGTHYPLFVFDETTGEWYRNKDKYSKTTTRHAWRFSPGCIAREMDTDTLKQIIHHGGWVKYAAEIVSR